ncbi:MAG: DUF2892 domain-containing protein [Bacteroidia bacterium]|nr:DUF2892 domain-containing protein [Bacteroidia bacterium]
MKKNMGTVDKVIRIVIAIVFVVLFLTHVVTGTLGYILLALAAIFVITSLIGFCPLYLPFKINTGKKE